MTISGVLYNTAFFSFIRKDDEYYAKNFRLIDIYMFDIFR